MNFREYVTESKALTFNIKELGDDFDQFIDSLKAHGMSDKEWEYGGDDDTVIIPKKYERFTKSWNVKLTEGKKFHPIDVFNERWVITDGKEIINPESGAIYSIKQYKSMMKKLKKHDQYDDVFYPTEPMAKEGYETFKDNMGSEAISSGDVKNWKVEKLSYS